MSWLARIRNALRPDAASEDVEREMAFHLSERANDLAAHGMSPGDARAEARRRFGNVGVQQDRTRDRDVAGWLESIVADTRYAVRGLRSAPAFAAVAILSLALGIGANTAIFTLLNVAMFKTIPVVRPHELLALRLEDGSRGDKPGSFNAAAWEAIRDRQDVFSSVFAFGSTGRGDLSVGGEARPIAVGLVTGTFFSTLGVRPAAGRLLVDADDKPGCSGAVVLAHRFWQSEFGADPGVVGKTVPINGHPFTIAGVAEPRFFGLEYGYTLPIWAPQCAGPLIRGGTSSVGGYIIGRLLPGVTVDAARARMLSLTPGILETAYPHRSDQATGVRPTIAVISIERGFRFFQDDYGDVLLVLLAIVGTVLLIACANTANLLLARATARGREMAVRVALGAGKGRLVRQLLTESLLLAFASAALGTWFALLGGRALIALLSRSGDPILPELYVDWRVLGFTVAVAILTALVFGLAPAWRAARTDAKRVMSLGMRGAVEGHSRVSMAKALVVAQIALSLLMLGGASVLIDRWRQLVAIDTGFDADQVLLVGVNTRAAAIPDSARGEFYAGVLERLRAIPGVTLAASTDRTPIGNTGRMAAIRVDDADASKREGVVSLTEASDGYFATIGTRWVAGRDFAPADARAGGRVAIVNEELARQFFGGSSRALGKRFHIDWRTGRVDHDVIGVVANTKDEDVAEAMRPIAYLSLAQNPAPITSRDFAVRGRGRPEALASAVSTAILELHPRLSLRTRTLQSQIDESVRVPRTLGLLSGAFGALALLLASIGLYGIMTYNVARRQNEIGVRIALGADPGRIVRMVLADVGHITVAGVALGALLGVGVQKLLGAVLAGVDANVADNLALAATILAVVALAAASFPAWRAGKQDPVTALRSD